MNLTANWSYPTAIRFGNGRIAEIGEACAQAGIRKPLLVTDSLYPKSPPVPTDNPSTARQFFRGTF